jgi:tripartite-type tricarboxylate transporter receptor subunit TctC
MNTLSRRAIILAATVLALSPFNATAQTGGKVTRIILPVGAGSGVDAAARVMTDALGKSLGQPVVIENLPGAGGITGTAQIVKAPKDGNTIGVVSNNHVVNPSVFKSMPFDSLKDITPIMVVAATPFVLVVHPSVPAKDLKELLALAKAKPGDLNYGSSGNGTILHLAGQMLLTEGGVEMTHVPYRSTGQLMTDLLGGQVQLGFVSPSIAVQHIKSGALRAFGVTTTSRSTYLPDVPTIAEVGLPNYSLQGWFAAVAPAGLPPAEVTRLHAAFKAAVDTPQVREALTVQGYTFLLMSPEDSAKYFASEAVRMGKLVALAGVKPE